jgi:hypothetical protein
LVRHQTTVLKAPSAKRQFVWLERYGRRYGRKKLSTIFWGQYGVGLIETIDSMSDVTINFDDMHPILDIFSIKAIYQAGSEAMRSTSLVSDHSA